MALDNGDDDVLVFGVTVHADILIFGETVHAFVREVCLLIAMIVVAIMVAVGGGGCRRASG